MIEEKILIVEDDEDLPELWKEELEEAGDQCTKVIVAASYSEAVEYAAAGDIAYCLLDLGLPEHRGEDPVEIRDPDVCKWGFAALREISAQNPHVDVAIVSRFADQRAVTKVQSRLLREGLPIRRILNKNLHAEDESLAADWYLAKIKADTHGLDDLADTFQRLGLRVVHPLERRLARILWQKAEPRRTGPLPIIVLRGETRAGKDRWAAAFAEFLNVRDPNQDRRPVARIDVGHLGGRQSGEAARIDLFGCRNFQNMADAAGVFERATAYRRANRFVHQLQQGAAGGVLARSGDDVDYGASSVAHLVEFGNLPTECQQLLLSVLDSNAGTGATVQPAGGGGLSLPVGCAVVLTTNADIENRVVPSDQLVPGALRSDLYRRLRKEPDGWLEVPSLRVMGSDAVFAHLQHALNAVAERPVKIRPGTKRLLDDLCEEGRLDMEGINTIVTAFVRSGDRMLMTEHVRPAMELESTVLKPHPPANRPPEGFRETIRKKFSGRRREGLLGLLNHMEDPNVAAPELKWTYSEAGQINKRLKEMGIPLAVRKEQGGSYYLERVHTRESTGS